MKVKAAMLVATSSFLCLQGFSWPVRADSQMGYQTLSAEHASALPRNGGTLGMTIGQGRPDR